MFEQLGDLLSQAGELLAAHRSEATGAALSAAAVGLVRGWRWLRSGPVSAEVAALVKALEDAPPGAWIPDRNSPNKVTIRRPGHPGYRVTSAWAVGLGYFRPELGSQNGATNHPALTGRERRTLCAAVWRRYRKERKALRAKVKEEARAAVERAVAYGRDKTADILRGLTEGA